MGIYMTAASVPSLRAPWASKQQAEPEEAQAEPVSQRKEQAEPSIQVSTRQLACNSDGYGTVAARYTVTIVLDGLEAGRYEIKLVNKEAIHARVGSRAVEIPAGINLFSVLSTQVKVEGKSGPTTYEGTTISIPFAAGIGEAPPSIPGYQATLSVYNQRGEEVLSQPLRLTNPVVCKRK
ncbi:MAG: hypothetical protein HQ596_02720 [Candidatus Saganbacteria bacterium]|nr:hypothetical protein [Candidatus Saganbacteria bacterium]